MIIKRIGIKNAFIICFLGVEEVYSQLDFYTRGYYFLQSCNRDLARRNRNLRRELRELRDTIESHEDFIFGPLLFDFE